MHRSGLMTHDPVLPPDPENVPASPTMPQRPSVRQVEQALANLYAWLDTACRDTNAALAAAGETRRLQVRWRGVERRYCSGEPARRQPFVSTFAFLPPADCHLFGGVYITTSATRCAIYLVPWFEGTRSGWTVVIDGTPFSATVARDLFAGVFLADAPAASRVQTLTGFDLFQTPWS